MELRYYEIHSRKGNYMKKTMLLICFILITATLSARELIHAYYGNYREVMRVVFVLRSEVHYNTFLDTDNRSISILINDAVLSPAFTDLDFSYNPLINDITIERTGNGLRINISTHIVYYAETFLYRERQGDRPFKIVVDVFRQKEPTTIAQAREYIIFYDTVGYKDRADALRRRIARNEFLDTEPSLTSIATPPIQTPPPINTGMLPVFTQHAPKPWDQSLMLESVLLYLKPDDTFLNDAQRSWVNEGFRLYDLFKQIHYTIEQAERTLRLYDTQTIVNITFIDSMSKSYNSLSNVNIQINEIRLQFMNMLQREFFETAPPIEYTRTMIHHVLNTMDSYQKWATEVQTEYDKRINR